MKTDPTSLENLHDIVMPPPLPWWPPAPGWLWLGAILTIIAVVVLLRWFSHFQRNRYRRDALKVLAQLDAASADPQQQNDVLMQLSELLKRCALTAYGRKPIASLTGAKWFALLDRNAGTEFAQGLGTALEESNYLVTTAQWSSSDMQRLLKQSRHWIKHHQAILLEGSDTE